MRRIKTIAIECLSICDLDRLFFFSRPGVVARFGGWRPFRCVCFPLPEVFGISGFWGVWRAVGLTFTAAIAIDTYTSGYMPMPLPAANRSVFF